VFAVIDSKNEFVLEIDLKRGLAILAIVGISILTVGSYLMALATYVAPSEDYPIHITSASTQDSSGVNQTSFERGEVVMVNVSMEMAQQFYSQTYYSYFNFSGPTDYLLLVQIMKGSTPVYLGFVSFEIPPLGEQSVGIGLNLPGDAAKGTYTAKIMVWDSWDDGGAILADNSGLEVNFSVT